MFRFFDVFSKNWIILLFSDDVSKAEPNVPFVETSDFFAKLTTKLLDLINYPNIVGLNLFKIKTVRKKLKPHDLIGRLYEFLYFITFLFTILRVDACV